MVPGFGVRTFDTFTLERSKERSEVGSAGTFAWLDRERTCECSNELAGFGERSRVRAR